MSMTEDLKRVLMRARSRVARVRPSLEYQVARWRVGWENMELVTMRLCRAHNARHLRPLSLGGDVTGAPALGGEGWSGCLRGVGGVGGVESGGVDGIGDAAVTAGQRGEGAVGVRGA